MANGTYMTINGTAVHDPAYGGVTITDEPIWAANTGRSQTGKMIGDIVAWKTTIEVTWPPLSMADTTTLYNAIRNAGAFFDISYYDLNTSEQVTKTVYCNHIPRQLVSITEAYKRHAGVSVTFIEQ